MVTERSPLQVGFNGEELGFLLRDDERDLDAYRSESAPPTLEGSLASMEVRSEMWSNQQAPPANDRWRLGQSSIGDQRKGSVTSSAQLGFGSREWTDREGDGLIGLSLGRQKSFAEIFQEDLGHANPVHPHPSRPASCNVQPSRPLSRNAYNDTTGPLRSASHLALYHDDESIDSLRHNGQNNGASMSHTFASVLGSSLSRSGTPDPQLMARAPSPGLPPVGARLSNNDNRNKSGSSSFKASDDLVASLSRMNLSTNDIIDDETIAEARLQKQMEDHQNFLFGLHGGSYAKAHSASLLGSPGGSYGHAGHSLDHMAANNFSSFENAGIGSPVASPGMDSRMLGGGFSLGSNMTGASDLQNFNKLQMQNLDPLYVQYLRTAEYTAQVAASNGGSPTNRGYMGSSYLDLLGMQQQYLGAMLQQQKQYGMPFVGKSGGYYGNSAFGLGMGYPASPVGGPLPTSPVGPGSPLRLGERSLRFPSGARNLAGVMGSWHLDNGNMNDSFVSSLLDEFKNNKTKSYELSDIAGKVVEFSADQYGSRFIQQKLETATTEEKDMVYEEIMPHSFSLMTDVFGNYVIQKFFEHGSSAQRRELGEQLIGHVLTLSLQMYGCRVIQKAIEVVDLDQKTRMVAELDGHIMRCVRDQNGNHVIQKCIECIPQDAIQFIVSSFFDQVVVLSTHPYGCRVIQRVLEHCDDPKTQQIMMDEILPSVCMLAQDQYGNYVVQHVLEHGKPHERTIIIKKLAGQIVQMSQQKFASNVVEKCLAFGDPAERQILVNEMLGTNDENEPLQAMMKDQFANYVVQKVLETCDDRQREYILSRIKVHLNALKKYTYGKHIVARVEKLVAAGERRIGMQSSSYSS